MKKFFLFSFLTLFLTLAVTVSMAQNATGENLVSNPGFEDGTVNWHVSANTATIAGGISNTGQYSLFYHNTRHAQYRCFTQTLNVKPNDIVRFSVWIKGEGITHKDNDEAQGAGITLESVDANGKVIGTASPRRLYGTFDWQKIGAEYLVHHRAARTYVSLYLRPGTIGKVWFDDVEVQLVKDPPIQSFMTFPNYRGIITPADKSPWRFKYRVVPEKSWEQKTASLAFRLTDSQNNTVAQWDKQLDVSRAGETSLALDTPSQLAVGKYVLQEKITAPDGELIQDHQWPIQVVAQMPQTYIDREGFTVVDGKRFFPLGLYLGSSSHANDEHLQRIADGGFNTVLNYAYGDHFRPRGPGNAHDALAYLDRAEKHNLKVVYSVKDMYKDPELATRHVELLKGKKALLSWYINDELPPTATAHLKKIYDMILEKDPQHPAFQVLYQVSVLEKYFNVTDILATDPYPINNATVDLTRTTSHTRQTVKANHGANATWIVPQIFDNATYHNIPSRQPTRDEMRNQAYQAIINGAKGLLFYSYFDLFREKLPRDASTISEKLFQQRWKDVATMGEEIQQLIPALLEGKAIEPPPTEEKEVQRSVLEYNGQLLILIANPFYEQRTISIAFPEGYRIENSQQEQITGTMDGEQLKLTISALGSGVFRLTRK